MKTYIENSNFIEFSSEIAEKLTVLNYGADTYDHLDPEESKYTAEAQEYFNEQYDEVQQMMNDILGIHDEAQKEDEPIILPINVWDIIEKHHPRYHSEDRILHTDILQKFIDDKLTDVADLDWIFNDFDSNKEVVAKELVRLTTELYQEALENILPPIADKQQSKVDMLEAKNRRLVEALKSVMTDTQMILSGDCEANDENYQATIDTIKTALNVNE